MSRIKAAAILLLTLNLILPVCVSGAEGTPETVSIESLVQKVLAHNPELEFYQQELAAARGEERASGLLENPEFEGELGRKTDLSGEGTAWSVSVVQAFEFPGRLALRKAIANRQVKIAELGLARFKAALAAHARQSAYELLAAQQVSQAAHQVSARGLELAAVLVQREPAGVAPLLETRIIEASVISLQKRAIDAEKEAQRALFELNQLTGEPFATPVKVTPAELYLTDLPPVDELIAAAMESNFELQMKVEELNAQGFKVSLAKNERYPGFKVGPFFAEERTDEREQVAGLGISVPLPVWNRNSEAINAADARLGQARTALFLARREVERGIRENALSYTRRLGEIQRWRPNVISELREAAELGDRHYRLGAIPVSTYIELQSQYLEALEVIFSLQQEALGSLQALETSAGRSLRKSNAEPGRGKQ